MLSYIYYLPKTVHDAVVNLWPLLVYPVIVWLLRAAVQSFYQWQLARNRDYAAELESQMKEILNTVKDKEKYKVAMEILERFDPTEKRKKFEREQRQKDEEERERLRRDRERERERQRNESPVRSEQLRRRHLQPAPQFVTPQQSSE